VRGWIDETFARLVSPGLAVLTFTVAHLLDKNGFVAAYVAGLTLAVRSAGLRERLHEFGEADGTQFSLFVFLLFGMVMVPSAWPHSEPRIQARARAAGDGAAQGHERATRSGEVDVLYHP
jgi:NhaP-type Na+/H+ and K+/H+ antiporter